MNTRDDYITTDVLVLGGGLGGCFAAIKAAEAGANVVLFEKAEISRSGNGNTGLHRIPLIHPDYNYSFEEFAKLNVEAGSGICDEDVSYEFGKDTLDRVLDLESYGVKVKNDDGSFVFMPAYDICPGTPVIWGPGPTVWHNMKPLLAKKVRSFSNVDVLNRTMGVGLLTEDGKSGGKIMGAIGLRTREGQFITCLAKAVILTTGGSYRLGRHKNSSYAPTRFIECGAPTNCGDGVAMAYRAGADIVNSELTKFSGVWKDFSHWGVGPLVQLWYDIRDGNGKPIVAEPDDPLPLSSVYKRTMNFGYDTRSPFFYDASTLEGYPEDKGDFQRVMWGLENEATSVGYFEYMKQRGEDFRKAPVEFEWHPPYLHNCQGGIHMGADAKATLEGLYCAGDLIGGSWRQSAGGAFVFGARAGRNAAEYARKAPKPVINDEQVNEEKERILKATNVNPRDGYSWIELEDKARQIASEYGPPFTNDAKLERGLYHLERIRTRYLPKLYARTPREMMRVSEVNAVFSNVESFLRAGLFRKECLNGGCMLFEKTGYSPQDDTNLPYHTLIRCVDGEMTVSTKPVKRLSKKK
jgi:succinate dehydrogenase/fumarate reductase flavoprotein subunit